MKYILPSLICLIIGALAGFWFAGDSAKGLSETSDFISSPQEVRLISLEKETQGLRDALRERETDVWALEEAVSELKAENEKLTAVTTLREKQEDTPQAINPFLDQVRKMAAQQFKGNHDSKIEKLRSHLNLTPEQLAEVQSFFNKKDENQLAITQKLLSGEGSMEQIRDETMAQMQETPHMTIGDLLEDILQPEQLEAYETLKEREKEERREASAYSELAQMQRLITMNEQQKDAVLEIHYSGDHKLEPSEWDAYDVNPGDLNYIAQKKKIENERLLESLRDVLSPDQMTIYQKELERRQRVLDASMNMFKETPPQEKVSQP